MIIDIRSQDARELHGVVPGACTSRGPCSNGGSPWTAAWRNPYIGGLDQRLILICDHGYSSVLAAGNLVELGFHRSGDVIGGFEAWAHQGLPIAPWRPAALRARRAARYGPSGGVVT